MKKTMKAILCMAAVIVVLAGCGNSAKEETTAAETKAAETTATAVTYSDEELTDDASITIGNYLNLERTIKLGEVTEDDIDAEIEYLCSLYPAEITGRPAKEGDVANIDYVGMKDGEAFVGGTAGGYDLTLGSGQFIDGFEDGVIGMEIGEERDLNLTFPENYGSEELAGQDVVFHVTLNAIKDPESTEIDDALARRVLGDVNATVETLRDQVRESLEIRNEGDYFNYAGVELLQKVIEDSEITTDPQMVEKTFAEFQENYEFYASQYGIDLETFLSRFMGTDMDGLRASAEYAVKQEMVLDAIIEAENLTATDERKDALARINYFENADEMIAAAGEETAERLFKMGAACYFLLDNSVLVEADE